MTEFIFCGSILLFVSLSMVGIGLWQIKSQSPVGFYSGVTPPAREELTDVRAWNRKHGLMWVIYGVSIIASYLLCALLLSPAVGAVVSCGTILIALPLMILYHHHLVKILHR